MTAMLVKSAISQRDQRSTSGKCKDRIRGRLRTGCRVSMRLPNATRMVAKVSGMPARMTSENEISRSFTSPQTLGQFVAAAEALHPGNHDAGAGPQRDQRSRDQDHPPSAAWCLFRYARAVALPAGRIPCPARRKFRAGRLRSCASVASTDPTSQQGGEKREDGRVGRRLGDGERVVLKRAPEGQPQQAQESQHERLSEYCAGGSAATAKWG